MVLALVSPWGALFRRWQAPRVLSRKQLRGASASPYMKQNMFCLARRICSYDDGTRCFHGEDNSAIFQPIELKLSEMVGFTIAEVIYYVPCCLMT